MIKAEQIAEILNVQSTDVIITNDSEARLKDRELTEAEQEQIAHVFWSDTKNEIEQVRAEGKARTESVVSEIADIIKSQDFNKATTGKELADKIRGK